MERKITDPNLKRSQQHMGQFDIENIVSNVSDIMWSRDF